MCENLPHQCMGSICAGAESTAADLQVYKHSFAVVQDFSCYSSLIRLSKDWHLQNVSTFGYTGLKELV